MDASGLIGTRNVHNQTESGEQGRPDMGMNRFGGWRLAGVF